MTNLSVELGALRQLIKGPGTFDKEDHSSIRDTVTEVGACKVEVLHFMSMIIVNYLI